MPLAAEVFVVNEEIEAAGTFDRLVGFRHGEGTVGLPLITDIKTGSKDDPEYAAKYGSLAWSIQLATYAMAQPHGVTWEELSGSTQPEDWRGIIWYIPRGSGKCYAIWLDLLRGWAFAQTARSVYDARKTSTVMTIREAVTA